METKLGEILSVRINSQRTPTDEKYGSGVIYRTENCDYDLVFTAKHCICRKNSDDCEKSCDTCKNPDFAKSQIKIDNPTNESFPSKVKVLNVYNVEERDFSVIKVSKFRLPNLRTPKIFLNTRFEGIYGWGFPSINNFNMTEYSFLGTSKIPNSDSIMNLPFESHVNSNLEKIQENLNGFSGTGIFDINDNLIGIYTETQCSASGFGVIIDEHINSFLIKNELESFKIEDSLQLIQDTENSRLNTASIDLRHCVHKFGNISHIERKETTEILNWILTDIKENVPTVGILVGNAGVGKTVILHDLDAKLREKGIPVLSIKADKFSVNNRKDLSQELELGSSIDSIFEELSLTNKRIVLIVDQIDALSQTLSSNRKPIDVYHRLISNLSELKNVRVVVSCREYDLDYDPILQEYKQKKIFRTSLLEISEVDKVLDDLNLFVAEGAIKLREFLRTPLHLQLFCKIDKPSAFGENVTLQNLYDVIWKEFIIKTPELNALDSNAIQELIRQIASKMYDKQQIVVNEKVFIRKYLNEITYLSSNELISNRGGKIQFIHQSFFDYSYARTFIENDEVLSDELKNQHQGLFVRSRVKQVISYLRDYDDDLYIDELKSIILGDDFRFHIKLLLINNLGFYSNPKKEEKLFVKRYLSKNEDLLLRFIDSIRSVEWFNFLVKEINVYKYFETNNEKFTNRVYVLCNLVSNITVQPVFEFVSGIPFKFKGRENYISKVISYFDEKEINTSIGLFNENKYDCDSFVYYHYLRQSVKYNPDFVVKELKNKLLQDLPKVKGFDYNYIEGGHDSLSTYKMLYELHPDVAINYFISAIEIISEYTKYTDKEEYMFVPSSAYSIYIPSKGCQSYLHLEIYDWVLEYLDKKIENEFDIARKIILPLLKSRFSSIINIATTYFAKYPECFVNEIYDLISRDGFFIGSLICDSLFEYNVIEMLGAVYSYLSEEQQIYINSRILKATPEYHKRPNLNRNGISIYPISRILYNPYRLISVVPDNLRCKYVILQKLYQEQYRIWGKIENKRNQGMFSVGVCSPLPHQAYKYMSIEHWKKSFRRYDYSTIYGKGSGEGGIFEHSREFENLVSEKPDKFVSLIEEIIEDKSIVVSYMVCGLEGLVRGKYNPIEVKILFKKLVEKRFVDFQEFDIQNIVRLTDYFIENEIVDKYIIDFLIDKVVSFKDGKRGNSNLLNAGMYSIKGSSAIRLISCYKNEIYREDIFSTLESIAVKAEVHTRAAILDKIILLNNLDKNRNLKLYLSLMHDYNVELLKMPLSENHPLLYLINVNFEKLIPFFKKATEINESHKLISRILFYAWLSNHEGGQELLDSVLSKSSIAIKTSVKVAFEYLHEEKYSDKCWSIINRFLDENEKEIGEEYDSGLLEFNDKVSPDIIEFIDKYVESNIGKYRNQFFYEYLIEISKDEPHKCIEWSLNFNNNLNCNDDYQISKPLDVILQSYNAIREEDKEDQTLEKAMDAFDGVLQSVDNRWAIQGVLQKLDE